MLAFVFVAVIFAPLTPASQADETWTPKTMCSALSDLFQGAWDVNSDGSGDAAKIAAKEQSQISKCSLGPARDYAAAYTYALAAAAEHHAGEPWQTDMNLAEQLLERCVTHYYGTKKGAQCQTDLETNIHSKVKWQSEDGR